LKNGQLPSDLAKLPFSKAAVVWTRNRVLDKLAHNTLRIDRERMVPLKAYFGDRKLKTITLDQIYEYRRERHSSSGPRTINLEVQVMRMVLGMAKCWTRIGADYKPLPVNRKGPGKALPQNELEHLIQIASSRPQWEAAFLAACLAANTTMRGVEIKQLRHRSVDWRARLIYIQREGTKTDGGIREIPINDDAALVLKLLIERANALGSFQPDHYLFPACNFRHTKTQKDKRGLGYDPSLPVKTWRTAWRSLRAAAGLPKFRFHDLRHTAITIMAVNGIPVPVIKSVAGHLNSQMTEYYIQVGNQAKSAAVAALSVFAEPSTSTLAKRPNGKLFLIEGGNRRSNGGNV
jgi:integrase